MKERTISTNHIALYKKIQMGSFFVIVVGYGTMGIFSNNLVSGIMAIIYVIAVSLSIPSWLKRLKLIKQVSYTKDSLYIHEKNEDVEIPLERLGDVDIESLNGMYKIYLLDKEMYGPYIFCKTSMWYPFNYKKVDKELDWLRHLIRAKKRRIENEPLNQLHSSY
ncbi:MAG: hypothetical protein JXQ90_02795 [Cyclobacteriaceae bacterium]